MQRHVFVPLGQSKRRKVRKTNIFVTLISSKLLTFGKTQINLVFRSLIRNFAGNYGATSSDI